MIQPLLLFPFVNRIQRPSAAQDEPGNRPIGGLHLLHNFGLLLRLLLNPVPPIAVALMIVQFVIDDVADKLNRCFQLLHLDMQLGMQGKRHAGQERRDQPLHTHHQVSGTAG